MDLFPIDIGMVSDVPGVTKKEYKIAPGTKNMTREAAMTRTEAIRAILTGIEIVGMLKSKSYEILATGEMGIGNTTTSSAVASVLTDIPVKLMTGRGAGLSADGLRRKIAAIERAISLHAPDRGDPIDIISKWAVLTLQVLRAYFSEEQSFVSRSSLTVLSLLWRRFVRLVLFLTVSVICFLRIVRANRRRQKYWMNLDYRRCLTAGCLSEKEAERSP